MVPELCTLKIQLASSLSTITHIELISPFSKNAQLQNHTLLAHNLLNGSTGVKYATAQKISISFILLVLTKNKQYVELLTTDPRCSKKHDGYCAMQCRFKHSDYVITSSNSMITWSYHVAIGNLTFKIGPVDLNSFSTIEQCNHNCLSNKFFCHLLSFCSSDYMFIYC